MPMSSEFKLIVSVKMEIYTLSSWCSSNQTLSDSLSQKVKFWRKRLARVTSRDNRCIQLQYTWIEWVYSAF